MHNITHLRPKPEDVDYFGGCPTCWRNDGHLNVGREHWFICHKHRVKWLAGENLFSTWSSEPDSQRLGKHRSHRGLPGGSPEVSCAMNGITACFTGHRAGDFLEELAQAGFD